MGKLDNLKQRLSGPDGEDFTPNCDVDEDTLEIECEPEWDRGDIVEKANSPIKMKVIELNGEQKLSIDSTGDASDELFDKTADFVSNRLFQ